MLAFLHVSDGIHSLSGMRPAEGHTPSWSSAWAPTQQSADTASGAPAGTDMHTRVFRKGVKAKDINGHPPNPSGQSY